MLNFIENTFGHFKIDWPSILERNRFLLMALFFLVDPVCIGGIIIYKVFATNSKHYKGESVYEVVRRAFNQTLVWKSIYPKQLNPRYMVRKGLKADTLNGGHFLYIGAKIHLLYLHPPLKNEFLDAK